MKLPKGKDDKEWASIQMQLQDLSTGKPIKGWVAIQDGIAVSGFDKRGVAAKIYTHQKSQGNKNVKYVWMKGWVVQMFPGKKMKEILKETKDSLRRQGAKIDD